MKRIFLILFLIFITLAAFKEIKVESILNVLNVFNEGEALNLINIRNLNFERKENILSGYLDFYVEEKNLEKFKNFLNEKGVSIFDIKSGENRIYLKESFKNYVSSDFKTNFFTKFTEIFSSKNFYFILLITIIFYLLILPYI